MDEGRPTSWRSVYDLVRDTRQDILGEVHEVKDEVAGLRARFDTHMLEHAQTRGSLKTLGYLRVFISTILPVPAAIIALIALANSAVGGS